MIEVMSSGRLVPKATTVTPITKGETPNPNPIFSDAPIKRSEEYMSTVRLTMNMTIELNIEGRSLNRAKMK